MCAVAARPVPPDRTIGAQLEGDRRPAGSGTEHPPAVGATVGETIADRHDLPNPNTRGTTVSTLSLPFLRPLAPYAPVVLRVIVGAVMAAHGWQKLTAMGPATFGENMLAGLGVPAPVLTGWLVTLVELVGGVALVVGAFTRVAAILLASVLAGAVALVKLDLGLIAEMGSPMPGAELDLALIAGAIGVALLGPGTPSVDHATGIEGTVPVPAEADERQPSTASV